MANISYAYGSITIIAPSLDVVKWLYNLISLAGHGDYGTYLVDDWNRNKVMKNGSEYSFKTGFNGDGRWDYASNIERIIKKVYPDAINKFELPVLNGLENTTWRLVFDYIDREGAAWFVRQQTVVSHYAGNMITDCQVFIKKHEDLTNNLKGLFDIGYVDNLSDGYSEILGRFEDCDSDDAEKFLETVKSDMLIIKKMYGSFEEALSEDKEFAERYNHAKLLLSGN